MLAILLHLPNPPPADPWYWLVLLGTKIFVLQYWFRLWTNCPPVSFPGVLALLLITAAWKKILFHHSGSTKELGDGCKWPEEQAPQEKTTWHLSAVAWLMIWDYPLFLAYSRVSLSIYPQKWTGNWYMESCFVVSMLVMCLQSLLSPDISSNPFSPQHSSVLSTFSSTQQTQRSLSPGWKCPQWYCLVCTTWPLIDLS